MVNGVLAKNASIIESIKHNDFCLTVTDRKLSNGIAGNVRRLSDVWIFEKCQPGLLLNKDMKMILYSNVNL